MDYCIDACIPILMNSDQCTPDTSMPMLMNSDQCTIDTCMPVLRLGNKMVGGGAEPPRSAPRPRTAQARPSLAKVNPAGADELLQPVRLSKLHRAVPNPRQHCACTTHTTTYDMPAVGACLRVSGDADAQSVIAFGVEWSRAVSASHIASACFASSGERSRSRYHAGSHTPAPTSASAHVAG